MKKFDLKSSTSLTYLLFLISPLSSAFAQTWIVNYPEIQTVTIWALPQIAMASDAKSFATFYNTGCPPVALGTPKFDWFGVT